MAKTKTKVKAKAPAKAPAKAKVKTPAAAPAKAKATGVAKKVNFGFRPIEDRVLVRPAAAETVSKSGILLPSSAQEAPLRGVIVAVGPGRIAKNGVRMEMPVAIADEVVYGKYSGSEIQFGGEDYKILRADEILAIING